MEESNNVINYSTKTEGKHPYIFYSRENFVRAIAKRYQTDLKAVHAIPVTNGPVRTLQTLLYGLINEQHRQKDEKESELKSQPSPSAIFAGIRDWALVTERVSRAHFDTRIRNYEIEASVQRTLAQIPAAAALQRHGLSPETVQQSVFNILTTPAGRVDDWILAARHEDDATPKLAASWLDPSQPDSAMVADPIDALSGMMADPKETLACHALLSLVLDPAGWFELFPESYLGPISSQGMANQTASGLEMVRTFAHDRAIEGTIAELQFYLWQLSVIETFFKVTNRPGSLNRLIADIEAFNDERTTVNSKTLLNDYFEWLKRGGWDPQFVIDPAILPESDIFSPVTAKAIPSRDGIPGVSRAARATLQDDYIKLFRDEKSNAEQIYSDRGFVSKLMTSLENMLSEAYSTALAIDTGFASTAQRGAVSHIQPPPLGAPVTSMQLFKGYRNDAALPRSNEDSAGVVHMSGKRMERLENNLLKEIHDSKSLFTATWSLELPYQINADIMALIHRQVGDRERAGSPFPANLAYGFQRPLPSATAADVLDQFEALFSVTISLSARGFIRALSIGAQVRESVDALSSLVLFARGTKGAEDPDVIEGYVRPYGYSFRDAWRLLTRESSEIQVSEGLIARYIQKVPVFGDNFKYYTAGPGRLCAAPEIPHSVDFMDIPTSTYVVAPWLAHCALEARTTRFPAPNRAYSTMRSREFVEPIFGGIPEASVVEVDPLLKEKKWVGQTDNPAMSHFVIEGYSASIPDLTDGAEEDPAGDESARAILKEMEKGASESEAKTDADSKEGSTEVVKEVLNETKASDSVGGD